MMVSSQHLLLAPDTVHTGLHINCSDTLLSPVTCERSRTCTTSCKTKPCVFLHLSKWPFTSLFQPASPSSFSSMTGNTQMFMSRTSVGVAERSCPSPMFLVSMVTGCCCCACLRLVSSSDSICSWHALRQSWKMREFRLVWASEVILVLRVWMKCGLMVYPPGHSWWSVPAALSVSETSWHCPPFSSVSPPLLPPCCLLLPWTEG